MGGGGSIYKMGQERSLKRRYKHLLLFEMEISDRKEGFVNIWCIFPLSPTLPMNYDYIIPDASRLVCHSRDVIGSGALEKSSTLC